MKKLIIVSVVLLLTAGFAFSQAQVPGFSNTVYTNVGTGDMEGNLSSDVEFLGFIDYFSANVQAGGLTIAGDIAMSVLEGGNKLSAGYIEHNFNAVMTPFANFNFGVGTNLDWNVGPKPFSGPDYSAYNVPEYAGLGTKYEGLVKNHFADGAIAARYSFEDTFVVGYGMNLGLGENGNGIGIQANLDVVTIGFAYNGGFSESNSNIYLGASLYTVPGFDIDIWTNFDIEKSTSFGGRLAFYKDAFKFIPEVTVTMWSTNGSDELSMYAAIVTEMSLSRDMLVGANASFGFDDIEGRLNVTPHFVWNITDAQRLSVGLNVINIWNDSNSSREGFYWGIPVAWKVLF